MPKSIKILKWVASIAFVALALTSILFFLSMLSPPYATKSPRYEAHGSVWDHKLHCLVTKETTNDAPKEDATKRDEFLWVRADGRAAQYFIATDATFMTPKYRHDKYESSYWNRVEAGTGTSICLDHVSMADNKPLDRPYCALALDMSTLEYARTEGSVLKELGQCEVLGSVDAKVGKND